MIVHILGNMDMPLPATLDDIIADGVLIQSAVDRAFAATLGSVTGTEFSVSDQGEGGVEVRFSRSSGAPLDTRGTVAAWIQEGLFEWVGDLGAEFPVPELTGTHPLSDGMITAARALHGHRPAFIAPVKDKGAALVIVDEQPALGDVRTDLITGFARMPRGVDPKRAATGFAAARGLGVRESAEAIDFSTGTTVTFSVDGALEVHNSGEGLSFHDVIADAVFLSAEHQLLFDALFPSAAPSFDAATGTAVLHGDESLRVTAVPLAVIENGTWRWADHAAIDSLRRFGRDHGLIPLLRNDVDLETARQLQLIAVAKPVLKLWTHVIVRTGPMQDLVLLLDHPTLHLPEATAAAVEATLHTPLVDGVDARRAVDAYAKQRRLPADSGWGALTLKTSDGAVGVGFEDNQVQASLSSRGADENP